MKMITVKSTAGTDLKLRVHKQYRGLAITSIPDMRVGILNPYTISHLNTGMGFPAYVLFRKTNLYDKLNASTSNLGQIFQQLKILNLKDTRDMGVDEVSEYLKMKLIGK